MNQKLFWTLTASLVVAGIGLYYMIRWMMREERQSEQKRLAETPMPKALGFGAEIARRAEQVA